MYFFISFYLYLILILKYLFQVAETNYLILKICFYNIVQTKISVVFFEDFIAKNTTMQSKFSLDAPFNIYHYFNFEFACM